MNGIITLTENERFPVNGRTLHERLGIETPYSKWFPRMCEYGFEEGKDYAEVTDKIVQNPTGGRPATIHMLTLSMAKELCMLQRTDKGREVRQYLISVEDQWNSPTLTMARALKMADAEMQRLGGQVAQLKAQVEQNAPRVRFAQNVEGSDNSVLVGTLAKVIKQNGVDIGEKRLFQKLREDGYLCSEGERRNVPSQRAMDMKLFEVTQRTFSAPDGTTFTKLTTKVTGKGQVYFLNRYGGGASAQQSTAN